MESLKIATLCSISPLEFWELTPYEFTLIVNSYVEKKEEKEDEKLTLAYLNAMWTIQFLGGKNIPKLEDYLNRKTKKEMTDKDMLNQIKLLNNVLGGEINGC